MAKTQVLVEPESVAEPPVRSSKISSYCDRKRVAELEQAVEEAWTATTKGVEYTPRWDRSFHSLS